MKKILIVDDDPQIVKLLKYLLKYEGHKIVTALEGKTALKLSEKIAFDLFITDIIMPEIDGIELIVKLKNYNKKIIAISGQDENILETARLLGADYIFQKPLNIEEFKKAVKLLLT